MTRLLDDLLDVSRITHGRIVLRPEVVDLRDTARAAIEALAPLMAEQQTPLIVDMPDERDADLRRPGAAAADPGEPAQ